MPHHPGDVLAPVASFHLDFERHSFSLALFFLISCLSPRSVELAENHNRGKTNPLTPRHRAETALITKEK